MVSGFLGEMINVTEIKRTQKINKVNKMISEGWRLLAVTSSMNQFAYLIGKPKRNSHNESLAQEDASPLPHSLCSSEPQIPQDRLPS